MIFNKVNWKIWHWPWHSKSYDEDCDVWFHTAGIGPFQWSWYS
jgi:hypothetical protein